MAIRPGDPLPDVPLTGAGGDVISLATGFRGEGVLLVFLRHLGWLLCREHLVKVAASDIEERIACVSFAQPGLLGAYARELGVEDRVELYADVDRAAYAAFGFRRGALWRVGLHPGVWLGYAQALVHGQRPVWPRDDVLQLGGDVIADADGVVTYVYASDGPEDRPEPAELRRELAAA